MRPSALLPWLLAAATVLGAVCSVTILRGSDLTRLMVTLGVALLLLELANKLDWLTGGSDGGSIVAADYTGDSVAKTGFYAFDELIAHRWSEISKRFGFTPADRLKTPVESSGKPKAAEKKTALDALVPGKLEPNRVDQPAD